MADKAMSQTQIKIGNYVIGETLGTGTFGKVKGNYYGVLFLYVVILE